MLNEAKLGKKGFYHPDQVDGHQHFIHPHLAELGFKHKGSEIFKGNGSDKPGRVSHIFDHASNHDYNKTEPAGKWIEDVSHKLTGLGYEKINTLHYTGNNEKQIWANKHHRDTLEVSKNSGNKVHFIVHHEIAKQHVTLKEGVIATEASDEPLNEKMGENSKERGKIEVIARGKKGAKDKDTNESRAKATGALAQGNDEGTPMESYEPSYSSLSGAELYTAPSESFTEALKSVMNPKKKDSVDDQNTDTNDQVDQKKTKPTVKSKPETELDKEIKAVGKDEKTTVNLKPDTTPDKQPALSEDVKHLHALKPASGYKTDDGWHFHSKGGYRGEATLDNITDKAKKLGFIHSDIKHHGSPDDSMMGNGQLYKHPDGHELIISKKYGRTKESNRFSANLKIKK